jgi:hypothetical protein
MFQKSGQLWHVTAPRETSAPEALVVLGLLGMAAMVSVFGVLTESSIVRLAALIIVPAVCIIMAKPSMTLILLTVFLVSNAGEVLGAHGATATYTGILALAVVSLALAVIRGQFRLVWSPVFLTALLFLASRALSVFAAQEPSVSVDLVVRTVKDLAVVFIVTTLVAGTEDYLVVSRVAVLVLAGLAALTLVQEVLLSNGTTLMGFSNILLETSADQPVARHSGPLSDPNFWARILVLFVPLALSLWSYREQGKLRWCWLATATMLCIGTYLSGSRGGLISLGLAVILWFILMGKPAKTLLLIPILLALLWRTPIWSGLEQLTEIQETRSGQGDPSVVGRLVALEGGLRLFLDHPILGVGPGNFTLALEDYPQRPPAEIAPHNVYLEMAAEGGLVGLLAWILFYGSAIFVAVRALILSDPSEDLIDPSFSTLLARAAIAGLLGWAVASVSIHLTYLQMASVVIGLAAGLDVHMRRVIETDVDPHFASGTL